MTTPQDIEWAINASDHIWLTQARPITTLFPLPVTAPATDDDPARLLFGQCRSRSLSTGHANGDLLFPSHSLGNCKSHLACLLTIP